MSTETLSQDLEAQYQQYRTLSFSAIVSLILGFVSVPIGLFAQNSPGLLILPLFGMFIGVYSVVKLRKRTDEFTGLKAANIGLLLCTVIFIGGATWCGYCFATEVPEGFQRISFAELQPDPQYPQSPVPPNAFELNEQQVFVKGYVYPDGQGQDIKQFVLVPDMGTCCFGGQPKLNDMIQVTLEDPYRIDYSYYRRNLAGKFTVGQTSAEKVGQIVYQLKAVYVK